MSDGPEVRLVAIRKVPAGDRWAFDLAVPSMEEAFFDHGITEEEIVELVDALHHHHGDSAADLVRRLNAHFAPAFSPPSDKDSDE